MEGRLIGINPQDFKCDLTQGNREIVGHVFKVLKRVGECI